MDNTNLEIRALGNLSCDESCEELEVRGYVNEVETLSQPMRGKNRRVFREKIEKGAFKRAIDKAEKAGKPIKLLFKHNHNNLLASTKNGSLQLEEDDIGLKFNANLIDTSLGKDVHKFVKSGLISNMSFGFRNAVDSWSYENGVSVRTLHDFDITEISILDNPAYLSSTVSARSFNLVEDIEVPDIAEERNEDMEDNKVETSEQPKEKVEERAFISKQYSKMDAIRACFEAIGALYSLQSSDSEDHFKFSTSDNAMIDSVIDVLNNKMKELKNTKSEVRAAEDETEDEVRESTEIPAEEKPVEETVVKEEEKEEEKTYIFTKAQLDAYKKNVEESVKNKLLIKEDK